MLIINTPLLSLKNKTCVPVLKYLFFVLYSIKMLILLEITSGTKLFFLVDVFYFFLKKLE
jgi:hypothetical protein